MEGSSGTAYLYDTFGFLTFSAQPVADPAGSYSVFRNRIFSPADTPSEIPAADYFSLDVSAAAADPSRLEEPPLPPPPSASRYPHGDQPSTSELAWFRPGCRFKSPMLRLHKEILDFCDFVSSTPEEHASRADAVRRVSDVVKHIWPHCKVEIFGSFRAGLYLPTSDIDVVILESKVKTPRIGLYALARALSQKGIAKNLQVIAKARVPIIKFMEKRSGTAFDISFDVDSGPKAAGFIKDALQKLPPLRPLCMVLKVFLQQRELNEVYSGGIGSYALLVMLITLLQVCWREQVLQDPHQPMEHNLGILLVNFFDFFGRKLNNWDVGISCSSTRNFFLKSEKGFRNAERPYLLSIEDPQAQDNDIGRNSYNYFKVRCAFAMAYSSLTDAKNMQLGPQRSILGTIIRQDSVLQDRKCGKNGELTFSSLLPGAGESAVQQFDNGSDGLYNWQLVDDEPLPRETKESVLSSRKRKSKEKHISTRCKKLKILDSKHEELGGRRGKGGKKCRGPHEKAVERCQVVAL